MSEGRPSFRDPPACNFAAAAQPTTCCQENPLHPAAIQGHGPGLSQLPPLCGRETPPLDSRLVSLKTRSVGRPAADISAPAFLSLSHCFPLCVCVCLSCRGGGAPRFLTAPFSTVELAGALVWNLVFRFLCCNRKLTFLVNFHSTKTIPGDVVDLFGARQKE